MPAAPVAAGHSLGIQGIAAGTRTPDTRPAGMMSTVAGSRCADASPISGFLPAQTRRGGYGGHQITLSLATLSSALPPCPVCGSPHADPTLDTTGITPMSTKHPWREVGRYPRPVRAPSGCMAPRTLRTPFRAFVAPGRPRWSAGQLEKPPLLMASVPTTSAFAGSAVPVMR